MNTQKIRRSLLGIKLHKLLEIKILPLIKMVNNVVKGT